MPNIPSPCPSQLMAIYNASPPLPPLHTLVFNITLLYTVKYKRLEGIAALSQTTRCTEMFYIKTISKCTASFRNVLNDNDGQVHWNGVTGCNALNLHLHPGHGLEARADLIHCNLPEPSSNSIHCNLLTNQPTPFSKLGLTDCFPLSVKVLPPT